MRQVICYLLVAGVVGLARPAAAQYAADEIFGTAEMQAARTAMRAEMGAQTNLMLFADRLEYQTGEGDTALLWDGQVWYGGDIDKLWLKTEGEYASDGGGLQEGELQLLYGRPVSPFFDLQFGYRYAAEPEPERHFAVLGVQGLAPYWFELDAAAFLSDRGDLSARLEAEYELFLAQRLILQPRLELELAAQDVPELGIGSGLTGAEAGLRLRYEFRREVAPYFGVSWRRVYGETADLARARGDDPGAMSFVAGLRLWF